MTALRTAVATAGMLIAVVLSSSPADVADKLSMKNLLDLHAAGFSDSILVQKIRTDGIAFELTTDMMLEIKRNGLSDTVIDALMRGEGAAQSVASSSAERLYREARFAETVDAARAEVRTAPRNYRARTIVVLSLIKLGLKPEAMRELDAFKQIAGDDPGASDSLGRLRALLDNLAAADEAKRILVTSLKNYDAATARSAVDKLRLTPTQKAVLRAYLSMYEGRFGEASAAIESLPSATMAQQRRRSRLGDDVAKLAAAYQAHTRELNEYYFSPLGAAEWSTLFLHELKSIPGFDSLNPTSYIATVAALCQIAPLDSRSMDAVAHASMLSSDYEQFERVADRLLKAKGTIRIPCVSKSAFFWLVIDSKLRVLRSEPATDRPFSTFRRSWGTAGDWQPSNENKHGLQYESFALSFDEIGEITQNVDHKHFPDGNSMLEWDHYVLKIKPHGLVTRYALMMQLDTLYGELAQRRATSNLGRYVLHVIARDNVRAQIVDASHASTNWAGIVSGANTAISAGVGALGGSSVRDPRAFSSMLSAIVADVESTVQQSKATEDASRDAAEAWYSAVTADSCRLVDEVATEDLEALLDSPPSIRSSTE